MKVHFIGIGGTGMGSLAGLFAQAGHEVRGSDTGMYPPMSTQLQALNIPVYESYHAANLDWEPDLVVVGNVCRADHVELQAAQARQIPFLSFPAALGQYFLSERRSLVVAGTHGKTTTSSLLAWLLREAGLDPSYLLGGIPLNVGRSSHLGQGNLFVVEGDEYNTAFFDSRSKFLHYRPLRAILTSVEFDHVDIFADFAAVKDAFQQLVALIPADGDLIVNAEDAEAMAIAEGAACQVISYQVISQENDVDPEALSAAHYTAVINQKRANGAGNLRTAFEIFERGIRIGEFSTLLAGAYNISNILAAFIVARREGAEIARLQDAIRRFRGVKRRQELLGVAQGVRIIVDFAHHPTAVQKTLAAVRKRYPNEALHVCFEPRSSSSRRNIFFTDYVHSFSVASHVYIAPVYSPERVPEQERLDTQALARKITETGVDANAYASVDEIAQAVLHKAAPGDTVLLLSSGSFANLDEKLLRGFGDAVEFANEQDMPHVNDLCQNYGLSGVLTQEQTETLVIRDAQQQIVGCVNLQVAARQALLFSLAVAPHRRGEGLGWMLADRILRRAASLGVHKVFLLTHSAADFFAGKLGFVAADPKQIDEDLQQSAHFMAAAERGGDICMVYDFAAHHP